MEGECSSTHHLPQQNTITPAGEREREGGKGEGRGGEEWESFAGKEPLLSLGDYGFYLIF